MSSPPTLLYRHPAFAGHDTTPHPENPSRIRAIDAELSRRGLLDPLPQLQWEPASDEAILRVHAAPLLARLKQLTSRGGGQIDLDTAVLPDSLAAARLATGAGIHAVDTILSGEASTAFVLARPPGHHATVTTSMGFCLLNTIAIAAAHAVHRGVKRVAIIDWDVHHGNGTQDVFYDRNDVFFCSMHQYGDIFPGTGAADERGNGPGEGYTLNVPLRWGDSGEALVAAMKDVIIPAVREYAPDLILVSAGYDAHADDPLGGLRATDSDFRRVATLVRDLARETTAGRLIAVLEGGYNPTTLARCVADTVQVFDSHLL